MKDLKVIDVPVVIPIVSTAPTLSDNNDIFPTAQVKMRKQMERSSDALFPKRCLALDCEMVGVGPKNISVLARVSIVDSDGNCIFDTFVKIQERVTDYRTKFSGVHPEDLESKYALPFGEVRLKVRKILNGCTLVGHGLRNDLKILNLSKCLYSVRDTTEYIPFMKQWWDGTYRPRRLRDLFWDKFGVVIQSGEHSSVEDAAAAMSLYNLVKDEWEAAYLSYDINFYWSSTNDIQRYHLAVMQHCA